MLSIKRVVLERSIFIVLLIVIGFITGSKARKTDQYHSSLAGTIEEVYLDPRGKSSVLLRFKNTNELNLLSYIYNSNVYKDENILIQGDSIFKPMFSNGYDVYRKIDGKYIFLYHLKSEK